MSRKARQESRAILAAVVPEHRVIEAGLRAARAGLPDLAAGLAFYYAVITVYRGMFSPDDTRNILVLGCAGTTVLLGGISVYLRGRKIPLSYVWPYSMTLVSLITANMGLYQVLAPSPDALNNFGMLNVIVAVLAMNRRVVLGSLLLSTSTWGIATMIQPVDDWGNDATYLATTWVLAWGLHRAMMASLASNEALRLQVEMSLDASERRIDQRDRAVLALKASQHSLRRVVDRNPESVIIIQGDEVVYANRAFKRRVGLTSDQVVGKAFRSLVSAEDQDLANTQLLLDDPTGVELQFATATGVIATEIAATEVSYDGNPAVMLVSKDLVSDEQAAAERTGLAHRMMAVCTLSTGMARQLTGPLGQCHSQLQQLDEQLQQAPQAQRARVESALEGTRRAQQIVGDLLALSRQDGHVQPVDVHALLERAVRMTSHLLQDRATLVRNYGPTLTVMANEAQLGQALLNLLTNAAQAIEEGDPFVNSITLTTRLDGDTAIIELRDTGKGMTDSVQQRIFEPFYTTKPLGVGTGLGLVLCRAVATEQGGTLTVQSAPGEGACFRLSLPAAAQDD